METGQTIGGKYRLNRLLGTGGMASVWSATNVFTERQFAIKFMLPQAARTPEAARRFLLEAKVSARINHPNIIEIIDVGQAEDGSLFLVMELLNGSSLDLAIRRAQPIMTAHEFMGIMKDVALALAAAHRSGVIHRDLKPTNIFLHKDRDGRLVPKILDFGVSKILDQGNTSLTLVGTVLGSPLYMSPEQAIGAAGVDGRTDIFAFGSILFESMTGQRPYEGPNFNALIVAIATKQPKNIHEVAPDLPAPLRSLIADCLVTDREKRLRSFDEVSERIERMMPELTEADIPLPLPPGVERISDPDATAALPARKSGHTPVAVAAPAATNLSSSAPRIAPPVPVAPTQTAPSWGGGAPVKKRLPTRTLLVAAAGAGLVLVLLVVVGLAATLSPAGHASNAASQGSGVAASTGTVVPKVTQPPAPSASAIPAASVSGAVAVSEAFSVPLIAVDSLPVAGRSGPAKGNGRLSIAASGGACTISIDGVSRGTTPLGGLELPAGTHRIDCVTPSGKTRTEAVTVAEGTGMHFRFTLDE